MTAGIVAFILFAGTLYLIFSEKLNRSIASLAGAVFMLVAGHCLGFTVKNRQLNPLMLTRSVSFSG